jgi:hypothetical protein
MTPQVQKNNHQGIPMLLPGPGNNTTAGTKKTQATISARRVKRALSREMKGSVVVISLSAPNH